MAPPSQTSARARPPLAQLPGCLHQPTHSTCTLRTASSSRIPRRVESNWPWRRYSPEANRGFLLLSWGQTAASTAAAETQILSLHLVFPANLLRLPVLCCSSLSAVTEPKWQIPAATLLGRILDSCAGSCGATKGRLNPQPTPPTCCDFGQGTEPR